MSRIGLINMQTKDYLLAAILEQGAYKVAPYSFNSMYT